MKAVVKYGRQPGQVAVQDVAEPTAGPDQVLVEMGAVGVCGSDIHLWHENQSWEIKTPVILGHEWCGTIVDVGANVAGFTAGERVAVETAAYVCGRCTYCLSGNYHMCPHRKGYGNLIDGAMTRYVAARPQILHRIPAGVSFTHAALTEPACVATQALTVNARVKPGDTVVIQGAGTIGIMALQVARISGAGTLIVLGTDLDDRRLEVAQELGADYVINVQRDDAGKLVRSLGDGFGADMVVDCTGVSVALKQALDLVRPLGTVVKIGWGPQPLNFNLDPLVGKAATLQGSFSHTYATWERVLQLMATGQLNLDPMIGGVYPLDEWEPAFHAMHVGENVKSVLVYEQ
ncbi:MAG: zinc-binding dehydrogenase [Caldilineaceae bacterium]|nr:zinc-binding dehydrogenase [Caldilineaceae bacterium]